MSDIQIDDFPELREARGHWTAGDVDEGLRSYELAVRLRPRNVRAIVEFARALGEQYQLAAAEALLDRAQNLCAGNQAAGQTIAQAFRSIYRPTRAIGVLEQLRQRNCLPLPLLGELSILYEQMGRLDDAQAAIVECVAKAPQRHEPKLILARIQRLQGEFEAAKQVLDQLTHVPDGPTMLYVRAWSELCHLRDQQGDYDGAVQAIEEAKSRLRLLPQTQTMSLQAKALNTAFAKLYSELDESTISEWARLSGTASCDVSGVAHLLGFPRSGTTLLEQVLDAHPKLLAASERVVFTKEIFPAICQLDGRQVISLGALRAVSADVLAHQRDRYLRLHEAIHGQPFHGRLHLDKNPNHTSLVAGLFRLFPESRFVFALRDPRDVVVSAYLRYFPLSEFSAGFLTWEGTCSLYAHEMNIWLRMRRLIDNWFEVRYEDTVSDLRREAKRVLRFLGLDWDDAVNNYQSNLQGKLINSPSHAESRQPVYERAVGRWRNYQKYLEPQLANLEHFVQAFGYG